MSASAQVDGSDVGDVATHAMTMPVLGQPVNFCFVGSGGVHHRVRGRVVRVGLAGVVIEDPRQMHRTALPPRVFRLMVVDHCDCPVR